MMEACAMLDKADEASKWLNDFRTYRITDWQNVNYDLQTVIQEIRKERRKELCLEGHRWFDLVRWGIAAEVMDKDRGSYGKNESDIVRAEMANFIKGRNELFPLPAEELDLNPMEQNPGY